MAKNSVESQVNIGSKPQRPSDQQGPGYENDTPDNWLRGMGKGEAEGKPNFDHVGNPANKR